ncbi:teneurin-m isoform X3 [Homalodisca vitripennis]|nr:teneurin-m isoform X3 [Homalodisca vitripennis]
MLSLDYASYGKGGRLYPTYPVSGSDGEDSSPRLARRTPLYQQPAGLSDTPTSDNASDATLTDSELALARDSTLLVHNGCLVDSLPPDVPPRNPTMSRLNGRVSGHPHDRDRDPDFEPSCVVRTPSGNVYIPADAHKGTLDYKSNSSCSSPSKVDIQKNSERCSLGFGPPVPVLPVRNNLRRPNSSHHFGSPPRFQFQKSFASRCSWKCTAIVFIILSLVLTAAVTYMSMANLLHWSYHGGTPCSVLVGEETSESAAKASVSDVGNRNYSSGRQRPSQPSQNTGGIYVLAPSQSRKRRSLDTQHDPIPSVVNVEMHDSTVEILSEHESTDYEISSASVLSSQVTNTAYSVGQESTTAPVSDSQEATNTPASTSGTIFDKHKDDFSTTAETSESSTEIITLAPKKPALKSIDSSIVKGPNHNFYKQNIIRRMQDMILAGHMSESIEFSNLNNIKSDDSTFISSRDASSSHISIPSLPFLKQLENNKTIPTKVKFENNTYDFQSDSPVPPYIFGQSPLQQLRKVETILHPLTVKQIKKQNNEERYKTHLVGSIVRAEKLPQNKIVQVDTDSGFKYGEEEEDDVEIFKLESFEKEIQEATDEDYSETKEESESKLKKFSPSEGSSFKNRTSSENNITTENTVQASSKFETTESSTVHPSIAPNPNVISLTFPNDNLHGSGNRLFVNVTIATSDTSNKASSSSALNPIYVLSLSLPTGNNTGDINIHPPVVPNLENKLSSVKTDNFKAATLIPGFINRGGECQCSCPCLSNPNTEEKHSDIESHINMFSGNSSESEELLTVTQDYNSDNESTNGFSSATTEYIEPSSTDISDVYGTESSTILEPDATTTDKVVMDFYTPDTSTEDSTDINFSRLSDIIIPTPETVNLEPDTVENVIEEDTEDPEKVSSTVIPLECPRVTPQPPTVLILEGGKLPARSFPPDGTTFSQITLGQKLNNEIAPYGYWNMQFYQSESAYIKFDYSIPRGASIAVYIRRNALPTHTQYNILEVLSGFKARQTRASHSLVKKEVTHFLEPGHWFLSLYNDDGDAQEVAFQASISEDMTQNCPGGCSGKGECLMGHCQCNPGFGGEDCSESVCPVLCSQRGEYINGECQCNPGWKGKECSLRHDECEVPDCNGHGHCSNGKCACARGFKGKFCEEVDCPHPTCSGHGFCADGTCLCKKGWKGADCSETDNEALQCLPDCSGHGAFDLETQTCQCEPMWSGDDCSRELCDLDCGLHGHCVGDSCMCNPGWSGEYCNLKQCDQRCNDHGQCKNGTCLCVTGWNGKHCTQEGCPNSCSGHGQCRVNQDSQWECRCSEGWDGADCNVLLEQSCNDGRDNDKDGLADCEDPECCSHHLCRSSQLCVSAPKPIDILLRKQPPAITASFFERMKFLIEDGSLQNYARPETFNESRSAVVRGRVVTAMGMGLMGVRVSTSTPMEGFTLTREDGWFDLLVNGGGAVTLQFGRSPFRPQTYIVNVPWNEVVIIDTVVMWTGEDKTVSMGPHACRAHDYDLMKPVVLATWKHGFQGACPDKSSILAESQVVQESYQVPGTGLNLVYHSSRAAGYLSTIQLQLTPETIPSSLTLIHLRITIEGILFEKTFEADPGIKFTYAWNRLNVYRQRVYGVTTALVKVGYQYTDCKDVLWDVQTTKLSGHDMSISEVGGWNLDIHHRYNFHEGILQKGDGSNMYLKHKPRIIRTTLGDGHQRPLDCADCDGAAGPKQRLLAPVALAAAPDGSIYVGDFNLVRRVMVDGTVRTVVRLNVTRVAYRYHIALSPLDGTLYISDPESHQILRVRNPDDFSDPDHNWEAAVGSGERCLPGDEAHCGDGALARDAKLAYPKGVAVSADNVLYFADGTNIRMMDRDGIVTTVIGNHMHKSHWKPIPCEGTLNVEEVHLRWPTDLAINPLDNSLHIIDDHMILQLTPDGRVKVVAGRPLHCPARGHDSELATRATLVMPQSIAFAPSGDLYVAESDSQRINRVRVIGTDGKISHYAGAESKCNCLDRGCDCFEQDHFLASSSKFNTISSVVVAPDGILHIADQANYRIRSVIASIPEPTANREYEVYSPETQEMYVFNRFGQHIATKNILTGETSYQFSYNVNTSNGKLSTVTDTAGNKVFLLRDYTGQVNSIENTKGQKCRLRMSRMKLLMEISTPDNYNVTLDYHGPTGLLRSKLDSAGRSYVYSYDEFGRLTAAVTPTGKVLRLEFDLSVKGAVVKVTHDDRQPLSMLIKGSTVVTKLGEAEQRTVVASDGSVSTVAPWGHIVSTDTVAYSVLADPDPVLAESYPVPGKQRTEIGGDLANRFEWRYFLRRAPGAKPRSQGKAVVQVGRKLRVNGDNLLTLEYDRETGTVAVFMDDRVELLNVTYDRTARPVKWGPRNGVFAGVELEYDRFSRLSTWRWGQLSESYSFDRSGRLAEIRYADGTSTLYAFKDMFSSLPLKVTTPRGSDYLLQYDDAGALQSLTTPRGHIHAFSLQTSLGFFKYQYYSPMSRHPFELRYNDEGQVLAKLYPHQSGRVAYVYDQSGKLDTVLAGLSSIHYTYQESTSLVKNIDIIEPSFELKHEFKYHMGILKDEKLKFGSKSGLHNTNYRYEYDGNARISGVEVDIDGKELPKLRMKFSQNLGMLEGVSDLRIYRNTFNRSVMQDTSKQFFTITEYDSHARVKSVLVNIKSFDVYRMELEYDSRGRISAQKLLIGRTSSMERITYSADGHVLEVVGTSDWKFVYDENGNIVSVMEQGQKLTLGYDSGDRVVQVGDVELNGYDARGFVVRRGETKLRYNSRGQLSHATERDRFTAWYRYDDRGRLLALQDAQGNITQFLYADPHSPYLLTHLHYPKTGRTFRYLYDEKEVLVAVETSEQRFYVASDQNGSPLALFDTNGNIIKELRRTPFGRIIRDSNPDFFLPIDYQGGIPDPHTSLLYLKLRWYDPSVGQWMTPDWERLANQLTAPTDVFIYRFHNNDPINPDSSQQVNYMTDLSSWLKIYGYDVKHMLGSSYTRNMVYQPQAVVTSQQLAPDFGVMSGLQCIVDKVTNQFGSLDFVPQPLLKMESRTRNLLPRVAYRRSVFGEGLLISRSGGRALVSVVEGVNSVVQDVVTSVFNNSHFLDLHFTQHDQDLFYFVKDNALKLRDDLEELRRLGGMFNVSTHETADGKELRLHSADAVVSIRYGADPQQERHRLLKHAHKRAVERAWELEKALITSGLSGRGEWTEEEREELTLRGRVEGYEGTDIHNVQRYPQLADDPGNVTFRKDARRKRKRRTHRHDDST